MTIEKFLESLVNPYDNINIVLYSEYERVIAEYGFERLSGEMRTMLNDLNNNFGERKILNFYAEPHWSYDKTKTMIYHLLI